jgi:Flp pilus assembly secretin CpaC
MSFASTSRGTLVRALTLAGLAGGLLVGAAHAKDFEVTLDEAKIVQLPERVSTVVVGNPMIADITLQPGGQVVITGKGYGRTNMIALDRNGKVLLDRDIQVNGPTKDVVVVYRGLNRETYSCAPQCERRITLGDETKYFESTLAQTSNRNGLAQGKETQK